MTRQDPMVSAAKFSNTMHPAIGQPPFTKQAKNSNKRAGIGRQECQHLKTYKRDVTNRQGVGTN